MWIGSGRISEVRSKSRWKVEFYTDAGNTTATRHPIMPIRAIVQERAETLDPQAYPDHEFGYIGLENFQSLTGDLVDFEPKPGRDILSRSKVFRGGDVLYGRLRPNLNKVFLAELPIEEGICSGEFY